MHTKHLRVESVEVWVIL